MTNQMEMVNGVLQPMRDADQAAYDAQQEAYSSGLQMRLLTALAAHRYAVQNGGTIIGGNSFKTDPESRLALLTVWVVANANPAFSIEWKMANGNFETLDNIAIKDAGNAVLAFVQKCFDTEKTLITSMTDYSDIPSIITAFDEGMAT